MSAVMALLRLSALVAVVAIVCFDFGFPSGLGRCPRHPFMNNFNVTRFAGRWYEIERSFYLMELMSSCIIVELNETSRGQLKVNIKSTNRWTGTSTDNQGTATPTRRDPSVLLYKVNTILPNALAKYLPGAGFYQVLDTDYDNYAILWTCSSYGLTHTDQLWLLGRQKEIEADKRVKIYDFLKGKHLDSDRLVLPKNSTNCTTT